MLCQRIKLFSRTMLAVLFCAAAFSSSDAAIYNFTVSETTATVTGFNSAYFSNRYIASGTNEPDIPYGATGTGIFNAFLRVQNPGGTDLEQGYNTSFQTGVFDTKTDPYTTDLRLSEIPISLNSSGQQVYKFFMDMHESDNLVTLEALQVFVTTTPTQSTTTLNSAGLLQLANSKLVYSLDAYNRSLTSITTDNSMNIYGFGSGSGREDLAMFISKSLFDTAIASLGVPATQAWVVLYTKFSGAGDTFEEWDTLALVPEASSVIPLGVSVLASAVVLYRRRRSEKKLAA